MAARGYSPVPDQGNGFIEGQQQEQEPQVNRSPFERMKKWWNTHIGNSASETAPLINRHTMTLEPPKPSPLRTILTVLFIIGTFTVVTLLLILTINRDDVEGK